ncbi:aminotransferase class I/II-fold pyridoxal phosphate-dependent enzyme [Nocardia sp. NPDC050712]|uniref:aminotransferase class I/II-fold pyridoxal phosphate-dependent enzyme n=1 Tax=Nocardia sp. NPDC050712 TaxID=3155518 RepID=UPI0033F4F997
MPVTVADRVRSRIDRFEVDRLRGAWGGRDLLRSRAPGPGDVAVCSNDYLALAGDARIAAAMGAALTVSCGQATRPVLETALARHMGAAAGILCQSGWEANVGLLQVLSDRSTPVYPDRAAHASLWQGARMAGAPLHPFRHNDSGDLAELIHRNGPGIIAVDAIYSTSGSRSPLVRLCELAESTGSLLVVDESHALGVEGAHGAGLVAASGLTDRVCFRTASLAKAFVGRAGFVATSDPRFGDYFRSESHPAIFSTTVGPHDIAGLAVTLDLIRAADDRRSRLREIAATVRSALTALDFDLEDSSSQIVSLHTGPAAHAFAVRDVLESHGVLGSVFAPPATPDDRTLIRLSLHAGLTDDEVTRLVAACAATTMLLAHQR